MPDDITLIKPHPLKGRPSPVKGRLYLDKHAERLIAASAAQADAQDDDNFTTKRLADWLEVSTQTLEIARSKGTGPPYWRLGNRVRYRRKDVIKWLEERTHRHTAEYRGKPRDDAANGQPRFTRRGP
jgi:hypothetical protein